MARRIHDFDPPDRFLAGTVGQPGSRAFFLQARRGTELVSVAIEKAQVSVLAERLLALLAEVDRRQRAAGGEMTGGAAARPESRGRGSEHPGSAAAAFDEPGSELVELRPGVAPGVPGPGESAALSSAARLEEPVDEAFRAGTLSLAWDGSLPEVVIEALAMTEEDEAPEGLGETLDRPTREWDDADPSGPDVLRVHLTADEAAAFARAAQGLVAAGRPPCPLCGQPLDPQGHLCPRRNGHTPRLN